MKSILFYTGILILAIAMSSCVEEKDTEKEKPILELISPNPCDTLYFGEAFHFRVNINDNTGLGNISMDMHNNFGHHSHGLHESCNIDPPKDAVIPFSDSWIFSLPPAQKKYLFDTLLSLPDMKNDSTEYDTGDYHFHIYITDNDGYLSFTSLDVKVLSPIVQIR